MYVFEYVHKAEILEKFKSLPAVQPMLL